MRFYVPFILLIGFFSTPVMGKTCDGEFMCTNELSNIPGHMGGICGSYWDEIVALKDTIVTNETIIQPECQYAGAFMAAYKPDCGPSEEELVNVYCLFQANLEPQFNAWFNDCVDSCEIDPCAANDNIICTEGLSNIPGHDGDECGADWAAIVDLKSEIVESDTVYSPECEYAGDVMSTLGDQCGISKEQLTDVYCLFQSNLTNEFLNWYSKCVDPCDTVNGNGCPPECVNNLGGNGVCEESCNISICNFDGGDCAGTCEDACGGKSLNGNCYCDENCSEAGDCCLDICLHCDSVAGCGTNETDENSENEREENQENEREGNQENERERNQGNEDEDSSLDEEISDREENNENNAGGEERESATDDEADNNTDSENSDSAGNGMDSEGQNTDLDTEVDQSNDETNRSQNSGEGMSAFPNTSNDSTRVEPVLNSTEATSPETGSSLFVPLSGTEDSDGCSASEKSRPLLFGILLLWLIIIVARPYRKARFE